jgi:predicted adenine nucleotide alpha hydrolase (AANH) superfamily ATPase
VAVDQLLLHVCCGPCSTVALPAWQAEGLAPTLFFYNPNIQPSCEHGRRLTSLEDFARLTGAELQVHEGGGAADWLQAQGRGAGQERCETCLALRLRETARMAAARGILHFATTLTVSPYQRHDLIRLTGEAAAATCGVEFLYADLRPQFARSGQESRRLGLYRQRYCGCVPSKWEAWAAQNSRRRRAV